jgi:SAM-dependent methyltransferase
MRDEMFGREFLTLALLGLLDPGLTVADLGCGTGLLSSAFAARGHRVVGVDPAPAMLELARARRGGDRVEWVQAFAQDYGSEKRFDLFRHQQLIRPGLVVAQMVRKHAAGSKKTVHKLSFIPLERDAKSHVIQGSQRGSSVSGYTIFIFIFQPNQYTGREMSTAGTIRDGCKFPAICTQPGLRSSRPVDSRSASW